ncbi:MAG: type II toxin-antitoxin system VapC family toxin [Ignavibacteriae bacterium]|nr:type II toxin-antitoxin system VapC family toxin [Ignavibacteriota bacterium]
MEKLFVDTNILIYSTEYKSPNHHIAKELLIEFSKSHKLFINSQVLREYAKYISVVANNEIAISEINTLKEQFEILYENSEVFNNWLDLMKRYKIISKVVFDCNIVATMLANNVKKILTNNPKDFKIYENAIEIVPLVK